MGETISLLYPGQLFHEMFPELNQAVHHLGAGAWAFHHLQSHPGRDHKHTLSRIGLPNYEAGLLARMPRAPSRRRSRP